MSETTTTTLTEIIPEIIGEATLWMTERSLFWPRTGVAEQFLQWADLRGKPGIKYTFPKYAAIQFGDTTEGDSYTTTSAMDTGGSTAITAAMKQCNVFVSDESVDALAGDKNAIIAQVGQALGQAAAEKFDSDVMAAFSSLGATPTGGNATNSPLIASEFQAYITALKTAKAPGPYAAFFHPWGWYEFLGESSSPLLSTAASDQVAKDIWRDYYETTVFGVKCFTSAGQSTANAGADYMGAFISNRAMGAVWKRDLTVNTQRDELKRGQYLVGTMFYGVGVIDSTLGFQMLQDAD